MQNWLHQKTLGLFVKTKGMVSQPLFGGIGLIFMLHRVLPEEQKKRYSINQDLAITPEFLEETIIKLKQKGYQFISLDELHAVLQSGKKSKQKCICITLDDGYRDNVTYGLPVFQKNNIPFTIYITNCFPNKNAHFWWYWLEEKVQTEQKIVWEGKTYVTQTEEQQRVAYNAIREVLKNASQAEREKYAEHFLGKTKNEIERNANELALTWEELNELKKEPLATIGAHTMHHLSLAHQTEEEVMLEIAQGKAELEEKLQIEIEHFAYPYGSLHDANKREFELAQKLGFKTATLNHPGNIFLSNKKTLMSLARFPLGNSITAEKLDQYLNGIRHFAENGWRKNVVFGYAQTTRSGADNAG